MYMDILLREQIVNKLLENTSKRTELCTNYNHIYTTQKSTKHYKHLTSPSHVFLGKMFRAANQCFRNRGGCRLELKYIKLKLMYFAAS